MVEDAVQHDPDAALIGMLDEVPPVGQIAEVGIDLIVMLRVVAVAAAGVEDRVEVDGVDAKRRQVIDQLVYAAQVTTVIIAPTRLLYGGAGGRRCGIEAPRTARSGVRIVAAVAFGEDTPRELEHGVVVAHIAGPRIVIGA